LHHNATLSSGSLNARALSVSCHQLCPPALPKEWPSGTIEGVLCRGQIEIEKLSWDDEQIDVMQVIQESPLIDLLISHEMGMSRIQEAFELLASGQGAKIVVDPSK
jgi:hypothetical protein